MLCDHGGQFVPALYGTKITHFIAENVSHAKLQDLKSKKDLYVVTPDWITASVTAGKRLSETSYSLLRAAHTIQQSFQTKFHQNDSYSPDHVFSKSRFHLMGEIKHDLQDLIALNYLEAQQPPAHSPGPQCIYAHIDMDCYFVQVALLSRPEFQSCPCAVASCESSHSEISSCNYVAREQGVTKGMWMARAKELCPELIILPYEVEKIREVGREIE